MDKYKQIVKNHVTSKGTIKITSTFELVNNEYKIDDMSVTFNGNNLIVPLYWKNQTDSVIVRKICSMLGDS